MPQRINPAANHVTIMRTLDQNGGMGGYSDRKPSKLEQMRADYQKKLMKEKEEKMVHMYEENQRKALMRLTKNGHAGNGDQYSNGAGSPTGGKSVREFFNERRRMEASGARVPSIDQHYKQAKGYSSPGGWSNRTGSGNVNNKGMHSNKSSAGRDRAQPLAPIQRRTSLATETTSNNNIYNNGPHQPNSGAPSGRSGIPLRNQNPHPTGGPGSGTENPFNGRPALIKHQPLPPTANGRSAQERQPHQPSSLPRYVHPAKKTPQSDQQSQQSHYQQQNNNQRHPQPQQQQQHQQSRQPHPPAGEKQGNPRVAGKPRSFVPKATPISNGSGGRNGSGKLTDYQKWQLEQNQAREERLKKLGNGDNAEKAYDGTWDEPEKVHEEENNDKENGHHRSVINNRDRLNRLNGQLHHMDDDDDDDEDNNNDEDDDDGGEDGIPEENEDEVDEQEDAVKEQERALLEQIAAKQREMESLRKEREREEEEERREAALRKKQEAAERARQKKLDEERRKEEERQRKQEEEDERQERKREEQRQREEEKRNREDERRKKEEERRAAKRQAEEDRRLAKKQQQQQQQQQQHSAASDYPDHHDNKSSTPVSPRRQFNLNDTFRARSDNGPPIDEKPVAAAGNDASFYLQAAASSDASGSVASLAPCRQCGRKFAQDRLKKHQDACVKANRPRKEFNAAMKRVEGTEMAKYVGKNKKPEPPKKKSNWRAKHEEFIQSLRYAKKVTEYEKEGKDVRDLAPPPPSQNLDLVPCPHCGRTFNETAAERHIPRCQTQKTRPPPMNTRRR
ncbi:hypothetical protein EGW08_009212 [Elysia chlorotica]|uniref:C2HC/C3H-type domain-containing protein n=1 Tax=Elysia chlorotica TaxID=188477 RepID=A0A433TN80_ELYCH|nr:hypothetical protein EGW08_009212 [Elysia chlorotica]